MTSLNTTQTSFLARRTFGQPNYLLIALAIAFVAALVPVSVKRALETNTNNAKDWLPHSYAEVSDLEWFGKHFVGEQFALVSWDGCTLSNTERLDQLARKLVPSQDVLSNASESNNFRERARWYKRVISGPSVVAELTAPPLSLGYSEAVQRLEGSLVGPLKRDARGNSLGDETRTTCLVVYLSNEATKDNLTMRQAIDQIATIASSECAIPIDSIHMGGPSVDNIAIDAEATLTVVQLSVVAGGLGFVLALFCFKSFAIAALVFTVGALSAGISLAIVFYTGVAEVALFGLSRPHFGSIDAILMSMPAVVYVLAISGAIHLINNYQIARRGGGTRNAVSLAIRSSWWPTLLATVTSAIGLSTLIWSDIVPIKKFGLFSTVAVLAMVFMVFSVIPVFLHRFPIQENSKVRKPNSSQLPIWLMDSVGWLLSKHSLVCGICLLIAGVCAVGFTRLGTSVHLLNLFNPKTDIIQDYAWLEENLGNVVPMEVVITVPEDKVRTADEHAEFDEKQYRMTMLERLEMIREIQFRIEALPEVSRAISAATFAPSSTFTGFSATADRSNDYAINKSIEDHGVQLLKGDYLRREQIANSDGPSSRELWRVSARVEAVANPTGRVKEIDYGQFVEQLKSAVDPVLVAYQQRDMIVQQLHKQGKKLAGTQLCILYRTPDDSPEPVLNTQESVLANLLLKSGVQPKTLPDGQRLRGVTFYNLTYFDAHADEPQYLDKAVHALSAQDALILVSAGSDPTAKKLSDGGLNLIDVSDVPVSNLSAAVDVSGSATSSTVRSVYTGIVPVVYKTQRQLMLTLNNSMFWATIGIAGIMMLALGSAVAGLTAMLPNLFPFVVIFGMLGWLGVKVDIGIMMSASIALALALAHTAHFLTWFSRGIGLGLNRVEAVIHAYEHCAIPMLQTALIAGLGLTIFAFSGFTPTKQFGFVMAFASVTALIGDFVLLPALLCGPMGYYFGDKKAVVRTDKFAAFGQFAEYYEQTARNFVASHEPISVEDVTTEEQVESEPFVQLTLPAATSAPAASEERTDVIDGPHADLHARLRNLRRGVPQQRHPS